MATCFRLETGPQLPRTVSNLSPRYIMEADVDEPMDIQKAAALQRKWLAEFIGEPLEDVELPGEETPCP